MALPKGRTNNAAGRPKGAANKVNREIRDLILSDPSGDILSNTFACVKSGYRRTIHPETGQVEIVELSEKGWLRCVEIVTDRIYPKLQTIDYKSLLPEESTFASRVEIIVKDGRVDTSSHTQ